MNIGPGLNALAVVMDCRNESGNDMEGRPSGSQIES